jgi:hypothetical protein
VRPPHVGERADERDRLSWLTSSGQQDTVLPVLLRVDGGPQRAQPEAMTVIPLPRHGQWIEDLRGDGRSVRVSAHEDAGLLNLSIWRHGACVGTVRLAPEDVATLMGGLSDGLAQMAQRPMDDAPAHDRIQQLERRLTALEDRRPAAPRRFAYAPGLVGRARAALGVRLAPGHRDRSLTARR